MARYQPTLDIWPLSDAQRAALPIGQWVRAGEGGPVGRFYGQGRSTVVAWQGNARASRDYRGYQRALCQYGRSVRQ